MLEPGWLAVSPEAAEVPEGGGIVLALLLLLLDACWKG